MPEQMKMFLV